MSLKNFVVGKETDAYCTRCKRDIAHKIHALDANGVPARVECVSCHGQHKYHPPKSAKESSRAKEEPMVRVVKAGAPKSSSSEKTRPAKVVDRETQPNNWKDLVLPNQQRAKPYRISESFVPGDIVRHPSFGLGYVESRLAPQKISVLFDAGSKSLMDSLSEAE
jgi:Zn ribbon nucleic-acid-binding protein